MDKANVVHLHNGVLFSSKKKNDIFKFSGKWTELEKKNILSELTQTQKDKYSMYSLKSEYQT